MSWRAHIFLAVFISTLRGTHGAVSVSITSEPEGHPAGVYQAATPVILTCTHSGSSSVTYSWTCSGESNCFTQGLTQPAKKRGILRGGDTGTHVCTVSDGDVSATASTNITVTGIGFNYAGAGGSFHYVSNNSAIFIGYSSSQNGYTLTSLECASGTSSSDQNQLLFITPPQYNNPFELVVTPGHWKFPNLVNTAATVTYYIQSFSGGVFTCRMPDENGAVVDTSVGIYPDNYDKNSLSVSVSSNQSGLTLSLTCTSTGLPPTTVTWSKDGVEESCGDKYTITQRVIDLDNTVFVNTAVMSADSECDLQGLYQCTVQCHDDNGLLVKSAFDSTSVTVSTSCGISSTQSLISTSCSTIPITNASSSSTSSTTLSAQITVINSIGTWTLATQVPTITEQPSEGPPSADEILYAIIPVGAALLILLLLSIIICIWCCCLKQRRNGNQECVGMKDTPIQENVAYTSHSIKKYIPIKSVTKGILVHENLAYSSHSVGQTVSECPVQEREYEAVDAVSCKQEEARQIQDHAYDHESIKN